MRWERIEIDEFVVANVSVRLVPYVCTPCSKMIMSGRVEMIRAVYWAGWSDLQLFTNTVQEGISVMNKNDLKVVQHLVLSWSTYLISKQSQAAWRCLRKLCFHMCRGAVSHCLRFFSPELWIDLDFLRTRIPKVLSKRVAKLLCLEMLILD